MLSQLVQFNKSYQIWNINEGQFVPRCGTEILLLINYYKNDQIWLDISKPVFEYESHLRELENTGDTQMASDGSIFSCISTFRLPKLKLTLLLLLYFSLSRYHS